MHIDNKLHDLYRSELKINDTIEAYNVMCAGVNAAYVHEEKTRIEYDFDGNATTVVEWE